jgi:phosphotransferase system enzyme I (PtsP)
VTESKELLLLQDIAIVVADSHDLDDTLDQITGLIASRMGVEVCSLYLHEDGMLVLHSTQGLDPSAVGTVRMAPSEGLTGLTFQRARPVNIKHARRHPRFKLFADIGEESVQSYLGVPLMHRRAPLGVLTVQTALPRAFHIDEVRMLAAAATQLASVVAHARLAAQTTPPPLAPPPRGEPSQGVAFLRGTGVSPGFGSGKLCVMADQMDLSAFLDTPECPPEERLVRFDEALVQSVKEISAVRDRVRTVLGEEDSGIFHAHLLMLEDRALQEKIRDRIRNGAPAARAVVEVAREYMDAFLQLADPYLRERAADVRDVAQRLLGHLRPGGTPTRPVRFDEPTVVLSVELSPSELVQLFQPNLVGIAVVNGGRNSHAAILCRSAGIPAIMAVEDDVHHLQTGQPCILDGNTGILYLSPEAPVVREYERLAADSSRIEAELRSHVGEPAVSLDGKHIRILGNAAFMSDVPRILEWGGEGVGLYRTEFPFLIRPSFPTEDEQVSAYVRTVRAMAGRVVTFRTLDIGGDKPLPYLPMPVEENPQLGWRALRVGFDLEDIFRTQVRAILRTAEVGPVRILLPMVMAAEDLKRARLMVEEERERLRARGHSIPAVPVGAMIEVPSAAILVDRLAAVGEFFSIGTNDLAQYLLAVDRGNPKVAALYDPLHPAVIEVIGQVVKALKKAKRPVAVCGELAGKVLGAAALLCLGVEELSVSPGSILRIRRLVQTVDVSRLRLLAPSLRSAASATEARDILRQALRGQRVPEVLWEDGADT